MTTASVGALIQKAVPFLTQVSAKTKDGANLGHRATGEAAAPPAVLLH